MAQLYLPRNWSGMSNPNRIMVAGGGGDQLSPPNHLASNALISLLREGGQWDDVDDAVVKNVRTVSKYDNHVKQDWERDSPIRTPHVVSDDAAHVVRGAEV